MVSRSVALPCLLMAAVMLLACSVGADAKFCNKPGQGIDKLGKCVDCGKAFYSAKIKGNSVCVRCKAGKQPNAKQTGCEACPRNQYGENGVCKICPKGTYVNAVGSVGVASCLACTAVTGYGVPIPNNSCSRGYLVCSPDYPPITRGCGDNACWSDALQCCTDKNNPTKCVTGKLEARCAPGRGLDDDRRCQPCAPGFYNNGKPPAPFTCKACPAGTQPIEKASKCGACAVGWFSPNGIKCKICPKGSYSQRGAKKCTYCRKRMVVPRMNASCRDYIICRPNALPKYGSCPAGFCFNKAKACCVRANDPLKVCWKPKP